MSAWMICPSCGRRCVVRHDAGCWECHPEVPPGTPDSREIAWYADLGGMQTFNGLPRKALAGDTE